MHIVFISPNHISVYKGGQERYTHELATGLVSRGHLVTLLCPQYSGKFKYNIRSLPLRSIMSHPIPTYRWISKIKLLDPDIIHTSNHTLPFSLLNYLINKKGTTKKVLMYLAPSNPGNLVHSAIIGLSEIIIPYSYDAISTLSSAHARSLSSRISHMPIISIPPSLPTQYYTLASKRNSPLTDTSRINLLFVGALDKHHYYKGLFTLISALQYLDDNYHLSIVGSGDHIPYLNYASAHNLNSRITFLGDISTTKLKSIYRASDALVLPSSSTSEGFGIVLLEALSQGTPVITTTCAGASDLLKNHPFAAIVPPQKPRKLGHKISTFIAKDNYYREAIKFARAFTRESLAHDAEKLYLQLLK